MYFYFILIYQTFISAKYSWSKVKSKLAFSFTLTAVKFDLYFNFVVISLYMTDKKARWVRAP